MFANDSICKLVLAVLEAGKSELVSNGSQDSSFRPELIVEVISSSRLPVVTIS